MVIDEKRVYSLKKFSTKKGQKSIKDNDHNLMWLELKVKWSSFKSNLQRTEIYNLKNKEDFAKFKRETENNKDLINCFNNVEDLNISANKWLKTLNMIIKKCFRKVRIGKPKSDDLTKLFTEKELLREKMTATEENYNEEIESKYEEVFRKK